VSTVDQTRIRATYEIRADASEIEAVARALATEQSVEMPITAITDRRVLDEVVGRVDDIVAVGPDRFLVTLGLAAETVGSPTGAADTAQLFNMLFGNCSLLDDVRLVDVEFPDQVLASFAGPRHGIAGLRRLCGAEGRPLSCTALKPQGLPPEGLAALCERFARAGLDLIKDDHGLADQTAAPFARRVEACQAAVARAAAATGRTSRYVPSLVGSPTVVARNAAVARDLGVQAVLVAPSLLGPAAFRELVDDHLHGLAVLAHPAFAGAARVDPPLLLGGLFRLLGADATIFPNVGGRFSYSAERCLAIAERARRPWGHVAACLPVPAGGMTTDRVPELRAAYGHDSVLLIGGALLAAGDGLDAEAARFVAAVAGTGE
jgi:ribulose-bisphosphate carboxylase large chain